MCCPVLRPTKQRDAAEDAADALLTGFPEIDAIWLFGSFARGDAGPESDVDILVVARSPVNGRDLRKAVSRQTAPLSFVSHTWPSLREARAQDWSFFVHLGHDGQPLHDPHNHLKSFLVSMPHAKPPAIRLQLILELRFLERFDDLSRFSGSYLFPLSRIFGVAKYVCMLDNTAAGVFEFNRDRAFGAFSRRHPDTAWAVEKVSSLWPFLARTQGRPSRGLPFSYTHADSEVEISLRATRALVRAAMQ